MVAKVDVLEKLKKIKSNSTQGVDISLLFNQIIKDQESCHQSILDKLQTQPKKTVLPTVNINLIDKSAIFHINQIKKLCLDYRLRFLPTNYFKGDFPTESINAIKAFETKHQTQINSFKIIAPSKLFKLKNTDDPILFANLGNNYYYFLYKWGEDMNGFRKLVSWPLKSFKNLSMVIFTMATILTAVTHPFFLKENLNAGYLICLWLFYIKGIFGVCLYLGVASGKNFTKYCWQSRYDKV